MGQPLYAYQAPTGYPDRAEAWVNTGSLLNRMNFGLQLAAGRVKGVDLDLTALDGGREPESREAALRTYSALLMPGRDLDRHPEAPHAHGDRPQPGEAGGQGRAQGRRAKSADEGGRRRRGAGRRRVRGWRRPRTGDAVKVRGRLGDEPKEPVDRGPPTRSEQVGAAVILGSPESRTGGGSGMSSARPDRVTRP